LVDIACTAADEMVTSDR